MVDPNSVLVFDLRSLASFPVPLRSRVKALGVKASVGVWVLPFQVQGLAFVFEFWIRLLHLGLDNVIPFQVETRTQI